MACRVHLTQLAGCNLRDSIYPPSRWQSSVCQPFSLPSLLDNTPGVHVSTHTVTAVVHCSMKWLTNICWGTNPSLQIALAPQWNKATSSCNYPSASPTPPKLAINFFVEMVAHKDSPPWISRKRQGWDLCPVLFYSKSNPGHHPPQTLAPSPP